MTEVLGDRIERKAALWNEISTCDHLLHIYDSDEIFLRGLEEFIAAGLQKGEGVIVIATPSHRADVSHHLGQRGLNVAAALRSGDLLMLDAEDMLSQFIDDGWPNDDKFGMLVDDLLKLGRSHERPVRAFGEMVSVLWSRGHNAATVRLEHLWQRRCREGGFSLFCAYPKASFNKYALKSLDDIRSLHTHII